MEISQALKLDGLGGHIEVLGPERQLWMDHMPRERTHFHTPAHGEGKRDHQGQHRDKPPGPQGKVLLKDSPTTLARTKAERAGRVTGLKAAQL